MVGTGISAVLSLFRPAVAGQDRRVRPPGEPVPRAYVAFVLAALMTAAACAGRLE